MLQYNKDLGRVSVVAEGVWNNNKDYDKLSIVYNKCDKFAYISRKTVPAGVDIENREYWQPLNVNGYADNNFINLTTTDENNNLTAYDNIVEAATSVNVYNRRVGAVMSFYNINSERLDRQAEFELWQFNSTDINDWTKESAWQNIYYNWNVFVGWYIGLDSLKNHIANPTVGQYAYIGSTLNDAVLVQCRTNNVWTLTNTKIRDYISVKVEGNVTIGSNGHWYCDGNDTGIPATPSVDEELDNIVTQIKTINTTLNALHTEDARIEEKIDSNKETLDKKINDVVLNLQKQITSNDEDISDLQTKVKQNKDTIDGIAVSGGASVASAVTYDNTTSGLESENIQNAIDELVNNLGHYETNEEWLRLYLDKEGHILWGIRVDGSIEWSVGIPTPIQKKLNELISSDDTIKQTITELREYTNQQLATKVDKEEGKSLIDDEVKDCFKIVENDEFIHCILDAEEHILFAIRRDTGKPYFPLNEMYHVEQNEEYFALWLDSAGHILMGIRRDGVIVGEINACNALKKVIASIQSDVAELQSIEPSLKELLNTFTFQENDEFLAVETDSEGRILSSTNADGSHYIHNAKSETIPEEFSHIDDPEGRLQIITDTEGKILSFRDSDGNLHENKIIPKHIALSEDAAYEIYEELASSPKGVLNFDLSKETHISLPLPRKAAMVKIYAPKLPTTKTDNIQAKIEYNDKDGNYFQKTVLLNAQGSSSMYYHVKNLAIDIIDGSDIKFGDFPTQDSFHLKKYYIDAFRGQCIVGYHLMEQVYKSHPYGEQYPYDSVIKNESVTDGLGTVSKDFFTGAKCHPDGFPIIVTFVNTMTGEETWMGIYTWNLKKSKEVYFCDKKKANNIILDGVIDDVTLFNGQTKWSEFEIRNPKGLLDIDGNKYDGDSPKELSDTDEFSKEVKDNITRFANAANALGANNTKETFEQYFLPKPFVDYELVSEVLYNIDGYHKNWIWVLYDGLHIFPTLYDVDSIWGSQTKGMYIYKNSTTEILGNQGFPTDHLLSLYRTEIEQRYAELRNNGIFTVSNIVGLLEEWCNTIGYDNYKKEFDTYPETPSYRNNYLNDGWEIVSYTDDLSINTYDSTKEYSIGDTCTYGGCSLKATKAVSGVIPLSHLYSNNPTGGGFYNSVLRVKNWLEKRFETLDKYFNFNNK